MAAVKCQLITILRLDMARQTSIDVYHQIEQEGFLSKRRLEVYKALFEYGPSTGMELLSCMNRRSKVDSQVRARLNELRELGVAQELGTKVCSITGMEVILWDVTSNLPIKKKESTQIKCPHCNGVGYFEQGVLL